MKKNFSPNPYLVLLLYMLLLMMGLLALRYAGLFFIPVFTGFIFAFLLSPILDRLVKWTKMTRRACSAIVVISIFMGLLTVMILLVPYLLERLTVAGEKLPDTLTLLSKKVDVFNYYLVRNFPDFVGKMDLMNQIERSVQFTIGQLTDHLFELFTSLYNIMFIAVYIILIPLFTFFLLKDYPHIKSSLMNLIPLRWVAYTESKIKAVSDVLASYIRGQALVVIILSVAYSLGLSLIGLPFPVIIGIMAGLGDTIPYVGTVVGLIISLIIGFVHFPSLQQTMLVLVVFAVVKLTENWFLYPKIVGKKVGLHFIWVLLSIIGFGKLFGFWGLLVAIPCSAVGKLFIVDAVSHYRSSRGYLETPPEKADS